MKKEGSKIKAVIFDVGNTLIFYDNMIAAKKMAKMIHSSKEKIFNLIDSSHSKFIQSYEKGEPSKVYFHAMETSLHLHTKIPIKEFEKAWDSIFWPNIELLKEAKKLRKKFKIGIISNIGKAQSNYFDKEYKISKLGHVTTYSCNVGTRKPDKKIYLLTLKKLKIKPEEAVFIDDKIKNISAANKLGIHGILFKNNRELFKEFKKLNII